MLAKRHNQDMDKPYVFRGEDWSQVALGEGGEDGDYAEWIGLLNEMLRPRFDSIEDFLPEASFQGDHLKLVLLYIDIGKRQLHAAANNRIGTLRRINSQVNALTDYLDGRTLDEEDLTYDLREILYFVEISGNDAEGREQIAEKVEALRDQAKILHESMNRDRALGQFEDYTALKDMFSDPTARKNIGAMTQALPYFLSLAYTEGKGSEQGTRRRHQQAVGSRQIDYGNSAAAAEMQKVARFGRDKRRRRRDRRDEDDD